MEIDNLLNLIDSTKEVAKQDNTMKERLTCVVVSGKKQEYLGRLYSVDEIEKLDEKVMKTLYARYEAALGGHTTKLLKEHIITYPKVVKLACPAVSQGRLEVCNTDEMCKKSLNDSPFIDLALTSLTSKMYHDYGQYMAPLKTVLLTSNFVRPVNLLQQEEEELQQEEQQQTKQQEQTQQQE